ncbi:MAG: hypothetical protein JJE52_07570 [Acidimicrobiia bacterium]|nr:hypothetical protein [Acidimicrobiia bacterium]
MSDMSYMYLGWGVPLVTLAVYSASLVVRGRALSRKVPAERRRWTS